MGEFSFAPKEYAFQARGGFKTPGWGKPVRATSYARPENEQYAAVLGSRHDRPAVYPAFKSQAAFSDWKARQQQIGGPGADYTWSDQDIDGDNVADGLVLDSQGKYVGVNGYRVGRQSGWGKQLAWKDPEGQPGRNRYVYQERKKARDADGSDTLATLKKQFNQAVVKPLFKDLDPKHPWRKVPRMGITNYLMNQFAGNAIDKAYLATNGEAIEAAGKSPAEAIAIFHRTQIYRAALVEALTPLANGVSQGNPQMVAQAQRVAQQYIEHWQASQGIDKPPVIEPDDYEDGPDNTITQAEVIDFLQTLNHWVHLGNGGKTMNADAMAIAAAIGVEPQYKTVLEARDRMRAILTGEDWIDEIQISQPPPIDSRQWLLNIIHQLEDEVEAGRGRDYLSSRSSDIEALYRQYLRRSVKRADTALYQLRTIAKQKGWLE
jgi:hypothetical protein